MRDLRSALSFLLLQDHSCDDLAKLLSRQDEAVTEDLARMYYPNAFADLDANPTRTRLVASEAVADERAVDRLVRRLREIDVGLVNSPVLDRRLDHDPSGAVPWMTFEGRSAQAWRIISTLTQNTPSPGDDLPLETLMARRRSMQSMWRRWAYFERRDGGWQEMLPYRSVALLERIVAPKDAEDEKEASSELLNKVLDAISLSEGLRNKEIRERYLALRITRVRDARVRSYRLFPKDSFSITVDTAPGLGDHIEYAPDAIDIIAERGEGVARLRLSLDLLEMLELVGSGYRPTTSDLQGLFVNLLIFRNELLTTTFNEVLLTTDDREFYKISAEGTAGGIRLALDRHSQTDAGAAREVTS